MSAGGPGSRNNARLGEQVWAKMPKVNGELLTLTYGSMVMQLIEDMEEVAHVNDQLLRMGHNIGVRLIDEFLAKSGTGSCADFRDTADAMAKVAFRMFLGVVPEVSSWNKDNTAFSLLFNDNPLVDFVELPPKYQELQYCNLLCGVIKGALEMVQLQVDCSLLRDELKGDDVTELRVELKGVVKNEMGDEYRDD